MPEGTRLTSRSITELKPRDARYIAWDPKNAGFGVRVTPNGTKSFIYSYRFNGAPRMLTIGNVPPLTLEQAQIALAKAKAQVQLARHQRIHEGIVPRADLGPATAKTKRRQVRRAAPTVDDLWTAYKEKRGAKLRPKTLAEYERMMKMHVRPRLGAMKAVDVKPHDVKAALNETLERGPVLANRVRGLLASIFNLAKDDLVIEESPVRAVRRPADQSPPGRDS